jgi:hypothetical protein
MVAALSTGMQVRATMVRHRNIGAYLSDPYLTTPYLDDCGRQAEAGSQVAMASRLEPDLGSQVNMMVGDSAPAGQQVTAYVTVSDASGVQVKMISSKAVDYGQQIEQMIRATNALRSQILQKVDATETLGQQVTRVKVQRFGQQITKVIYNVTQLRLLTEFASRGTPALGGNNWTASSQASGDFLPKNLNTDVEEEVYRSASTIVTLTCDTGVSQGVPVDTLAIRNHNLTKGAIVQLQGSNDSLFSSISFTTDIPVELVHSYWMSPSFPTSLQQCKYWRLLIQDTNNPDGHIQIGAILFGQADIISARDGWENPLRQGYTHFKDSLQTEGFTNVSNDRALKKWVSLDFKQWDWFRGNFKVVDEAVKLCRTSLKMLVIPDPRVPSRFAVFAKLKQMPTYAHTSHVNDPDADIGETVDFQLEWDESL